MLTLIMGKAKTGKTAAMMDQIRLAVQQQQGGQILIVPEQYSHEAERELAAVCGDSLSLYAEVLSFTALARRVAARMGGGAADYLDKGGRLLCMARTLSQVSSRLKVYETAARRSELQQMLLAAVDEMKTACITPEKLLETAEKCDGGLAGKLQDLALIAEGFDATVFQSHADPADRLSVLADQIARGGLDSCRIYADGFLDFTAQQRNILRAMLTRGLELTVCLTTDSPQSESELFHLSRREATVLRTMAEDLGVPCREIQWIAETEGEAAQSALSFFTDNLFGYEPLHYKDTGAVSLWKTGSISEECELAASHCLSLVQETGCRWRDIAIAVRGFGDYRSILESVFSHYGVPLYTARKSQLPEKPLPMFIELSYELPESGWAVDDVITLLHTGLTGLDMEECDELERYVYKWQLRVWDWESEQEWRQHPEGYGMEYTEETEQRLSRIHQLRRRFSQPLLNFIRRGEAAQTAREQVQILNMLLEEMQLPQTLEERAKTLVQEDRAAQAKEYQQLWEITVSAMEQCAAILGDSPMSRTEFGRLFVTMLSQYDVGSIPVSLDRVSAGDFDRMRRRSLKHLIVLGANDARLPNIQESSGVFSEDERQRLLELDVDLGSGGEWELWREYALIYNVFSLPSQSLTLCTCESDANGETLRPAYVYRRAASLFGIPDQRPDMDQIRCSAPDPALTVAARKSRTDSLSQAAALFFQDHAPQRFASLQRVGAQTRGRLSSSSVEALYGRKLRLSASRLEKLAACRFSYFCQYGLKAKAYQPAAFKPPEIGVFMHYVLENLAREVKEKGGFSQVEDEEICRICSEHIEIFIQSRLNGFREKSRRFVYLFRRICSDVQQIALDMAQELRRSDFEPMYFELDFSKIRLTPPKALIGQADIELTGIVDRVDGWLHEGKLYLRIVDYKTGKKEFSLSDVWYGMGLQMLLYLFALEEGGETLLGHELVPAGVMYLPARNIMLSMDEEPNAEKAEAERIKQLRRSGLVLDDEAVVEAWEKGKEKQFIPVKISRGGSTGLANLEQMGLLTQRIRKNLEKMARELRAGNVSADPYYKSQDVNACAHCDYAAACHFVHGENGERCRFLKKLTNQEVWEKMEGEEDGGV